MINTIDKLLQLVLHFLHFQNHFQDQNLSLH
nr:MAG TPA: hypothetical protein [Crassvirales sp.]